MYNGAMTGKALLLAALGLVLAVSPLRAEVVISDVIWQLAIQVRKHKRDYHNIRRWLFPPTDKAKIRVHQLWEIGSGLLSTNHPVLAHIVPMRRCNLACT